MIMSAKHLIVGEVVIGEKIVGELIVGESNASHGIV